MSDETVDATVDAEIVETAVALSNPASTIAALNNASSDFYSTIKVTGFKDRLALAKAINESAPLDENLGKEFDLANLLLQVVDINDRATGEVNKAIRTTLIDTEGNAYHGTSQGLVTSVKSLIATIGEPSEWEGEHPRIKIVEEGVKPRKYFTIKFL